MRGTEGDRVREREKGRDKCEKYSAIPTPVGDERSIFCYHGTDL